MIGVCNFSSPIRLRRMLARRASGWLVVWLLWPVGLAGQATGQVTLYTPDGSQQRTLSVPLAVDVDVWAAQSDGGTYFSGDRHGHGHAADGCGRRGQRQRWRASDDELCT